MAKKRVTKKATKKAAKPLKTVTIDVNRWLIPENVEDNYPSKLSNGGMRCCLGFWAKQAFGIPYTELEGRTMPSVLNYWASSKAILACSEVALSKVPSYEQENFEDSAANINDDEGLSFPMRKKKLTTLFKKVGVDLRFEGELRPTKKKRPAPR